MHRKELLFLLAASIVITIAFFWKFFVFHLYPIPTDFMIAWYEPWKTYTSSNGTITIPHKPIADDIFRQLYPFKILAIELMKDGQFPLWNPYNGTGMPLLATMHVGLLSPLSIFYFFFSNIDAWTISIILQIFFSFFFMYLYLRRLTISVPGSLFGSITYVCSAFIIVRSIYGEYLVALPGLPLLLFLIEQYMQKSSKTLLLLPFIIATLLLSGHPHISLYIIFFCTTYSIIQLYQKPNRWRKGGFLFFLLMVGISISAIQLLPTFELYQHANVSFLSSRFIFDRFLLPIQQYITLIIPNYFGNQATYNYWGAGDYIETAMSVGTLPILFALFFRDQLSSRKIVVFLITTILLSFFLTFKSPISSTIFSFPLPLVSSIVPTRIFLLSTISFSILAGFGFDILLKKHISLRRLLLSMSIPTFFILIVIFFNIFCFYHQTFLQ